jgi:hypothetical protein
LFARWVAEGLFAQQPSWEQGALLEAWQSRLHGMVVGDFYELPTVKGSKELYQGWQCAAL